MSDGISKSAHRPLFVWLRRKNEHRDKSLYIPELWIAENAGYRADGSKLVPVEFAAGHKITMAEADEGLDVLIARYPAPITAIGDANT